MESQKIALAANLGNTAEPVIKALETAASEGALTLYVAYGRAIAAQERTPFNEAHKISERARELGVNCRVSELPTPQEFEGSFKFYQDLMNEVQRDKPDRVIIDVTGGTKVMSAALVHAALTTDWDAEIIFEYVGGQRESNGRFTAGGEELIRDNGIVTKKRITEVLLSTRQQEYARALLLARNLPAHGKAGFLKKAVEIFWRWDNFHYDEADPLLREIAAQAELLVDDKQFQKIADTILRLKRVCGKIKLALNNLRQLEERDTAPFNPVAFEGWLTVLGDTIANSRRRLASDPVDCVLRCYRAIEVAAQIAICRLGINPWKPDWKKLEKVKLDAYLLRIRNQEPPRQLSLDNGIKLIEVLTSPLGQDVNRDIRNIMGARNLSYLEHGYNKADKETARSSLEKVERMSGILLSKANIEDDPLAFAYKMRLEA